MDEIVRIYHENTPNETSEEKKQKYEEVYVLPPLFLGAIGTMLTDVLGLKTSTTPVSSPRSCRATRRSLARDLNSLRDCHLYEMYDVVP